MRRRTPAGVGPALTLAAAGLTLAGVVLAVTQPAWLTEPLQTAVRGAGGAAPAVYVLLCVLAAPFHLSGVLGALSTVTWPLPVALALTFSGTLLGALFTALVLSRIGRSVETYRASWPAWLGRLAAGVRRRAIPVGLLARLALGPGLALEAFFVLTGYTRRQYLITLLLGTALWTAQTLVGVTLLRELVRVSPGLAGLFAASPLVVGAALLALRRARGRRDPA